MSDTLADKLRQITADDNDEADILFEAADRIEALEKALSAVMKRAESEYQSLTDGDHGTMDDFPEFKRARAALEGKDGN
jgi:hypothetical protein